MSTFEIREQDSSQESKEWKPIQVNVSIYIIRVWDSGQNEYMKMSLVLTVGSQPKRRVSLLVLDVHISASTKKEFYKLEVALVGCNGKSRVPGARYRGRINICPLHASEQSPRYQEMPKGQGLPWQHYHQHKKDGCHGNKTHAHCRWLPWQPLLRLKFVIEIEVLTFAISTLPTSWYPPEAASINGVRPV